MYYKYDAIMEMKLHLKSFCAFWNLDDFGRIAEVSLPSALSPRPQAAMDVFATLLPMTRGHPFKQVRQHINLPKHIVLHFSFWPNLANITSTFHHSNVLFLPSVNVRFSVAHEELTQGEYREV